MKKRTSYKEPLFWGKAFVAFMLVFLMDALMQYMSATGQGVDYVRSTVMSFVLVSFTVILMILKELRQRK